MSAILAAGADLRRVVRGSVSTDGHELEKRSRDFGRRAGELRVVVRPADTRDVAAVIHYAREHRLTVTTQAAAHSQGGQSLSDDGILLDLYGFGAVEAIDPGRSVVQVGAGVIWRTLTAAALQQGMVPPVLTDNLFTTIGGTASVGGIGFSSHRFGTQLDNHMALEVVTGDETRWCSADEHSDLFLHALGGLGQFGVITRVRHRLRRHATHVRQSFAAYRALRALFDDAARLTSDGAADFLRAGVVIACGARQYVLGIDSECRSDEGDGHARVLHELRGGRHVGTTRLLPYPQFVLGDHPVERPRWERDLTVVAPGLDLILPHDTAAAFLGEILDTIPNDVQRASKFLLLFLRRDALTRPMLMVPESPSLVLFTMEPVLPRARAPGLMALLENIDARGRALGAKRYVAGSVSYGTHEWGEHFGGCWPEVRRAKELYDPGSVFASVGAAF